MKSLWVIGLLAVTQVLGAYEGVNEHILRRACRSISQIEGDKIFLKPDKLYLKDGMIFVEDLEGVELPVPVVFSSEGPRPYMQVAENILFNTWKCDCGAWNHKWDNPRYCWHCGQPR